MDEYRKHVGNIHAPESLINTTLERIHAEKQNGMKVQHRKKHGKSNIIKLAVPALATAAAVMILVTQLPDQNTLIYNTVPDMAFRTGDISIDFGSFMENKEISVDEYSEYLDMEVNELFEGMELEKADIEVSYDAKGRHIVEDEGTLHYASAEGSILLECSRTKNMVPDILRPQEVSCIGDHELWLAVNEQESVFMAAGKINDFSYYIRSEDMERKQFEKVIKKFLKLCNLLQS